MSILSDKIGMWEARRQAVEDAQEALEAASISFNEPLRRN